MQTIELERIFGKKAEVIDYSRLKVGSKVMIQSTGQLIHSLGSFDSSKPVHLVLKDSPFIINDNVEFRKGSYDKHYTFHQNGKYVAFDSSKTIDYITSVVEY